jgi:hypothetical protein
VDVLRKTLLTRPTFTLDENRNICVGNLKNSLTQRLHRLGTAEQEVILTGRRETLNDSHLSARR